jgi:Tol biopolymer transport system component
VTGGRTITLSEHEQAYEYQPRWSADGSQILYLTREGVFVASALGGLSRRLASGTIAAAAWAPDGRQMVLARGPALSLLSIASGEERRLAEAADVWHSCTWSPRGAWIACVLGNTQGVTPGRVFGNIAPSAIVLVSVPDGRQIGVTDVAALNTSPAWSPDGTSLFFISNRQGPSDVYAVRLSEDGRPQGEPARVTTGLGPQSIAFSGAGDRMVYATYAARANLFSLPIPEAGPVDTSGVAALTSGNQIIEAMTVSRDGAWLVYDSTLHLNADIFRMPVSGGTAARLTSDPADDFAPELAPDGGEVAFHSFRSGSRDIWVQPVDGGAARPVTATGGHESYPHWSPDGRMIAFVDQRGMRVKVTTRGPDGAWGAPVDLAGTASPDVAWVDSDEVAFTSGRGVAIVPAAGGTARVVYAPARGSADPPVAKVAASADGRTLYFKSHDGAGRATVWSVPVTGGRPRLLVRFNDPARASIRPDFAVGAGRIFFTLEDRQADIWVAEVTRR